MPHLSCSQTILFSCISFHFDAFFASLPSFVFCFNSCHVIPMHASRTNGLDLSGDLQCGLGRDGHASPGARHEPGSGCRSAAPSPWKPRQGALATQVGALVTQVGALVTQVGALSRYTGGWLVTQVVLVTQVGGSLHRWVALVTQVGARSDVGGPHTLSWVSCFYFCVRCSFARSCMHCELPGMHICSEDAL